MAVFDPNIMYKAGRARTMNLDTPKGDWANRINKILGFVGNIALQKFSYGMEELGSLRKKARQTRADINTLTTDIGANLNPKFQAALKEWKKEYNKGSRMSALGLTGARKEKGEIMMNAAYAKMQNMHAKFKDLEARHAKYEKQGLLHLGEEVPDYDGPKWSSGTQADEFLNATRLANGTLLDFADIDLNTGDIVIGTEDKDGNVVTQPIDLLDWPDDADDALQTTQKTYIDSAIVRGEEGKVWDAMHGKYMMDEITANINQASEGALKEYIFGGTANDFSNGKLESSSPAYMMMIESLTTEKKYNPATREFAEGYGPGTDTWEGSLEILRNEMDFSKDSPVRKSVAKLIYDASESYHNNAYDIWSEDQAQKKKERAKNQKTNQPASVIVDGFGHVDRADAISKAQKMMKKSVVYDMQKQRKFEQDGKGNTKISVINDTGGYTYSSTVPTNEALELRSLGDLGYSYEAAPLDPDAIPGVTHFEDPKDPSTILRDYSIIPPGTRVKPDEYEPFETPDGNLVEGIELKVIGHHEDGSVEFITPSGKTVVMPAPELK